MNSYLILFLLCFVPLATHRYARPKPTQPTFFGPPVPKQQPPPPSRPPPSSPLWYRFLAYMLTSKKSRKASAASSTTTSSTPITTPSYAPPYQHPSPSYAPPPPPSSQYTYFASAPPVVQVPHRPSPVSRWFSSSAPTRARRRREDEGGGGGGGGGSRSKRANSGGGSGSRSSSRSSFYTKRPPLSSYAAARNSDGVITLTAFLGTEGSNVDVDMVVLMAHVQAACKHIAAVLSSPKEMQTSASAYDSSASFGVGGGRQRDDPRSLRIISNNILQMALRSSGKVAAVSSEEDDAPTWFGEGPFIVVFDPLDGSKDYDELTPTGTMFSIYYRLREADHLPLGQKAAINVMQRGERLMAAGYTVYSSATMMCFSVGTGLHGFTLDNEVGEFVLTHPDIRIPERGNTYTVNDGRYFEWPPGLREYVDTIRQGRGQNPRRYSAKHISSLVPDLHRTILYGGIAMNPRAQLRLVHEANALSFLVENAGGRAIDGRRRILEIQPTHLHQRLPLFLGSRADVSEVESYGDIQQVIQINPVYGDEEDDDGDDYDYN